MVTSLEVISTQDQCKWYGPVDVRVVGVARILRTRVATLCNKRGTTKLNRRVDRILMID